MDLLRLVLAHQPLEKLIRLPRLDGRFWRVRCEVLLHKEVETVDFRFYFTIRGELSTLRYAIISKEWLLARAVFLRQPDAYVYHNFQLSTIKRDPNGKLHAALMTGIPEIQASELSLAAADSDPIPDGSLVQWTSGLLAAMRLMGTSPERAFPNKVLHPEVYHEVAALEEHLDKLGENPYVRIEERMRIGYLNTYRKSFSYYIKIFAAAHARVIVLKATQGVPISEKGLVIFRDEVSKVTISKEYYSRVEAIFADKILFGSLERDIQYTYLTILGREARQLPEREFCLALHCHIGRPLPASLEQTGEEIDASQVSWSDICYDPIWWVRFMNRHSERFEGFGYSAFIFETKAYALGWMDPEMVPPRMNLLESRYEEPQIYRTLLQLIRG